MGGEFISPNWHVILIHYPIALLTVGVILELITLGWRKHSLRLAGRWMILFGAFMLLPTAAAGMYAFRDALQPEESAVHIMPWQQTAALSSWRPEQWEFVSRHIWLNGAAAVLILLAVIGWLAVPDRWRTKLYGPGLAALVVGVGLTGAGAWYGGEMVYHYGTAVPPSAVSAKADLGHESEEAGGGLAYFLPPLQLHVTLAGLLFAAVLLSLALVCRRAADPIHTAEPPADHLQKRPFSWQIWLAITGLGLITAIAGLWATMPQFSLDNLQTNVQMLVRPDHLRLSLHVLAGLALVLLPVGLAYASRYLNRTWAAVCSVALLLLVPIQLWLGMLLLFDSHEGPLTGFQSIAQAHQQDHGQKPPRQGGQAEEHKAKAGRQQPAQTIGMTDELAFAPDKVTIRVGETIRWKNTSAEVHTVTADAKKVISAQHVQLPKGAEPFDSGDMKPGAVFDHTFTVPGHYRYVCLPHEAAGMLGEIEVREQAR